MSNTLVFNPFDPVTGAPTVDGFVLADIGVLTPEFESGYVNGARLELGSSGLAPVVVNAVQDGNTLVLGFMCRGDTSFDSIDMVMLALRGSGGEQRRIDIKPNWGDEPDPLTVAAVSETGYGAADPDGGNPGHHLVQPASPLGFDIRTNKPAHIGPTFYRRSGSSGSWSAGTAPTGFECKVRSWRPLVTADSPTEIAWSVELRIPVSVATGGVDWLDLGDDFGVFIDVFRAFRYLDAGDPLVGWTQYKFPSTAADLPGIIGASTDIPAASFGRGLKGAMVSQGQGVRIKNGSMAIGCRHGMSTAIQTTISATEDNTIVAQLENTDAAVSGIVAEVRMANWGLGAGQFAFWHMPPGCANPSGPVALAAGTPGSPSATVETANSWPAASVPIDYKTHTHQCMWVQLKATGSPVVFTQGSARRNMDFIGLSEEQRDAEISAQGYPKPENGSDNHEFLLRSRCRKIVVSQLIGQENLSAETIAIVGGAVQYAVENDMVKRDRIAGVETHTHLSTNTNAVGSAFKDSVVYLWITEGLRRTHKTMEIDGVKGEIWDNGPGDFSLAAFHNGVDDPMGWQLSGPGLIKRGDGVYGIKVKDGQTATIGVKVGAGPEIKPGDSSDLPSTFPPGGHDDPGPKPNPNPGCPFQLILLAAIPTALYAIGHLIA